MAKLILLSGPTPTEQDQRLRSLTQWMGITTKTEAVEPGSSLKQRILDAIETDGPRCLAMSSETLALLHRTLAPTENLRQFILECRAELLVYDCARSTEQDSALSALTAGMVCGIRYLDGPDRVFALPREAMAFSRQLAGLSISAWMKTSTAVFEFRDSNPGAEVIASVGNRPVFVRLDEGPTRLFLSAGSNLPDLAEVVGRDQALHEHYDRLVPILIFLRHCFGESCWHGQEATARLIIDDPLLTKRYGFLDFDALLKSMQGGNYGTSIAFIPWNFWRTSTRSASRILTKDSRLSICIHGCDHTNKEFEAQSPGLLTQMAGSGVQRMEAHRKRTGAHFERVMVFPQGRFSVAAIAALRVNKYLAAVNTTCFPTDSGTDGLTVGELLRPAITRYSGFPIFQRRYPRRLFDLAFDLFLGKPALIVEHHGYFSNGYGKLETFVAQLYKQEPALRWPNLDTQLTRSCMKRMLGNGSVEVQFFTGRFQLVSDESSSGRFLLKKHEPNSGVVENVRVNGIAVPFFFENEFLKLELQVHDPNQTLNIEIVDREQPHERAKRFGIAHNTGVLLRRGMSEFRDNFLSQRSGLLDLAKRAAKTLKVTGDS